MVVDGEEWGYEGEDGRGETQQEEQVYVSVNVLPTELLPGGQIGIMTTARGAAAARWGGERKGRSGRGNRAVGDRSQIKADDTVSALKARQLGTLTWDSLPARDEAESTHHALILRSATPAPPCSLMLTLHPRTRFRGFLLRLPERTTQAGLQRPNGGIRTRPDLRPGAQETDRWASPDQEQDSEKPTAPT